MTDSQLSARELILTLIDSAAGNLSARYFVAAGELFGMDAGGIRVALARLVRDGALVQVERGLYGLGSRGGTLHTLVRSWSQVETSLKSWGGGWLATFTAHLGRTNKTRLRGRERALMLFGFAEAAAGLWVRPDNLRVSPAELRRALLELGLEPGSINATLKAVEPHDAIVPDALWDCRALERRYAGHIEALGESSKRLAGLDEVSAATETLLLGRQVTRDILLDPLLPAELVDTSLRRAMIHAMRGYDRQGKAFWRAFYQQHQKPDRHR